MTLEEKLELALAAAEEARIAANTNYGALAEFEASLGEFKKSGKIAGMSPKEIEKEMQNLLQGHEDAIEQSIKALQDRVKEADASQKEFFAKQ